MQKMNSDQVSRHQLNTSPSKQQFSFGKAGRFSNKPKNVCNNAFYDLPTGFAKRSTNFGLGRRSDFTHDNIRNDYLEDMPSPGAYEIKGAFEKNSLTGFSFGISRNTRKNKKSIEVKQSSKTPPGPGAYSSNYKNFGTEGNKWTLRPKTASPSPWDKKKKDVPGPGAYNPKLDLNESGIYFVSNYESSKVTKFSPASFTRFSSNSRNLPGPGAYDPKTQMAQDGNYFLSNFRSSNCCKFSKSERRFSGEPRNVNPRSTSPGPGPGEYIAHSDFGCSPRPDSGMHSLSVKSVLERRFTRGDDISIDSRKMPRTPSPKPN